MRLYDEYSPKYLAFFVTLTYKRNACPYFRVEDYRNKLNPLPLYRDCRLQRTFGGSKLVNEIEHLDDVYVDYGSVYSDTGLCHLGMMHKMRTLAHREHQIGVCYYPDVQKFVKRLKINLSRSNYHGYFKTYICSEYGEGSLRPHFHLLIFGENLSTTYSLFKSAVMSSWKMCNSDRWSKGFQLADDATSYVSSYVNKPADFPSFLYDNFRPKHSFSPHLGFNLKSYSLASLLTSIESGNLQYSREVNQEGLRSIVNLPIPKYVINRYFPLFKGYSRLTRSQVYDVLRNPSRLSEYRLSLDYSDEDIRKIAKQISNVHYKYFPDLSDSDYAILYSKAWTTYRSTCYRLFMEDVRMPILQKYDNLWELDTGIVHSDIIEVLDRCENPILHPNDFPLNVSRTQYNVQMFAKKIKTKKVSELLINQVYEL